MSAQLWLARCESDVPAGDGWLSDAEAARAAGMRFPKRRTEYRTRRWAAKAAVAHRLGLPADPAWLRRMEVRNAVGGAPEVYVDGRPARVDVSLTDRAGWAVCLLSDPGSAAGCDLELVEPRAGAFVREFLTDAEQRAVVSSGPETGPDLVANLVWSAKESALKVLRIGLGRHTRTLDVAFGQAPRAGGWGRLTVRTVEGGLFPGWWCRHGDFLLTVASGTLTPPPVSIEDPPALAAAVPAHGWLRQPA